MQDRTLFFFYNINPFRHAKYSHNSYKKVIEFVFSLEKNHTEYLNVSKSYLT